VTVPDNTVPQRRSRRSLFGGGVPATRPSAAASAAGLIGPGPHLSGLSFSGGGADSGTLSVELLPAGASLSRDPFAAPAQLTVSVSGFDVTSGWHAAPGFNASYAATPSRIDVQWSPGSGLAAGRYRLLIESDRARPPVDAKMRPLTPDPWARQFRLIADASGNLVLAGSLDP
jgi:hypothetical protein